MNSKQRRRQERYKLKCSKEIIVYIKDLLLEIQSGRTSIEEELRAVYEIEEALRQIK